MTNNLTEPQEITLLHLLSRYWRFTTAIVVVSCIALAALVTQIMPRRYESRMEFLVNNERADLVITPEKTPSYAPPAEVTETTVNSEIELLKSQDLLENVVRDQQLYDSPGKKVANPSPTTVAYAVLALKNALDISLLRKTNIIEITYGSSDPDLAVSVLRDLGDRYLNAHLAAHSTPGTYEFFTAQVAKYTQQLAQARSALSDFHRQKQLFSMPQQQSAAVEQLESVDAQLNNVTAEISEEEIRLAESAAQLSKTPERVTTLIRTGPRQGAADHLEATLADLRNRRIELAMKFKPGDRFLVEIDRQITTTEAELADLRSAKAIEQTTDLDVLHQSLKADYAKGQIALRALKTRRSDLAAMRQTYLAELDGIDQNSSALQNLEQNEKEALENYTIYSRRLDEARLADSLDQQKFSNVVMIEKPVSSPIPVSPKLRFNLAVGALLGIFLSLAIAFFFESKDGRSNTPSSAGEARKVPFEPQVSHAHSSGS